MKRIYAPLYLVVALLSAALAAVQPVEADALDAGSVVAIADQVWSSLAADDMPVVE